MVCTVGVVAHLSVLPALRQTRREFRTGGELLMVRGYQITTEEVMAQELWAIEVTLRNQQKLRVVADALVGPYAVHERIFDGRMVRGGWTVTHVSAGVAVWSTYTYGDALRLAQWLVAENILPEDAVALKTWCADSLNRTQLLEQLQRMAPRLILSPDFNLEEATTWS